MDYNTSMLQEVQPDNLEAAWTDCLKYSQYRYPFQTYAWYQNWLTHLGTESTSLALMDQERHVLLPLAITGSVARFAGGDEIADYLDIIGSDESKPAAWQEALEILRTKGVTEILLRNIPDGSPTISYLESVGATVTLEDTTPKLSLPGSWDDYVGHLNRKNRHEMKRKERKFEAEHPGSTLIVRRGLEADIPLLLGMMKTDDDKRTFLSPAMEAFFMGLPEALGDTLAQFTLAVDGQNVATTLAFVTPTSLLLYNSGYIRDFAGAGLHLKTKTVKWAIEQHIPEYNFLQGNERYKYELGARDYPIYRVSMPLT
jgi:CelD/BcsL family acetyltransferase involved in cellulose biosynthesis